MAQPGDDDNDEHAGWRLSDEPLTPGTPAEASDLLEALRRAGFVAGGNDQVDPSGATPADATTIDSGGHPAQPRNEGAVARRIAPDSPLGLLVQVFQQGLSLPVDDLVELFAPLPVSRLVELGLLEHSDTDGTGGEHEVQACVHLVDQDGLVVASDFDRGWPEGTPANIVMAVSPSSLTLAQATVRQPGAVLDLGTGNGIQALLASRHATRVVATDINGRAVSLARFSAWLNGCTNVEVRLGSLFEPVQGERFDVVTTNPPFVISPDSTFEFRDSGSPGDEFCAAVVAGLPDVLADGGVATVMCNWALRGGDGDGEVSSAPRRWVEGRGCDAFVLQTRAWDTVSYALHWLATGTGAAAGSVDDDDLSRWLSSYDEMGITGVAAGFLYLRRRGDATQPWFSHVRTALEGVGAIGVQMADLLVQHETLAGLADDDALWAQVLVPTPGHRLDNGFVWTEGRYQRRELRLALDAPLPFPTLIHPAVLDVVSRCDGTTPLRDVTAAVAAGLGVPTTEAAAELLPPIRALLEIGLLRVAAAPASG